ncbi:MAG: hypothetical protein ACX94C_02470 [Phycisphaerales bacterium]
MTGAINNLAASLAGNPVASKQASKAKSKDEFEKALQRRRGKDEYQMQVEQTEQIDAVRRLADADQEDAREDREARQGNAQLYAPTRDGRLDISA